MKTDICLILEGTYPYVQGGVSGWVHKLISSLNDFTFSIVFISSTGDIIRTPKYEIPPNILEFKEVFIHDFQDDRTKTRGNKEEGWQAIREFYQKLGQNEFLDLEKFYQLVIDKKTRRLNIHDIMYSKRGWQMLLSLYNNMASDVSFIDFYWTMRLVHIPILNLFNADIPDASLFHTVCTGYAGLLSVIAKVSKKSPLLLTEHGIYTHERKIDISRSTWIRSKADEILRATRSLGFFKDFWIKKFETLSKLTYQEADKIITLFEGNRQMQIEGGADLSKTVIIANGVDLPEEIPKIAEKNKRARTVGFVGRVVSIKDVKTFIRAMKIVEQKISDLIVYIMGAGEEEADYFEECRMLAEMLNLEDKIVFTGVVDVKEYYPKLDVIVLTSISEAQPLSILEAMSYGVPIIATDVGSCKELLIGKSAEDRDLGEAGVITNVGSPHETANAILKILENLKLQTKMSEIGRERIRRYYRTDTMINSYKRLYESFLSSTSSS